MKASKFTDAQKAFIIKQGKEGTTVAEICRKAGISQATYFNWKKKYAGMLPTDMKRLRELEDANSRLKKIVADSAGSAQSGETNRPIRPRTRDRRTAKREPYAPGGEGYFKVEPYSNRSNGTIVGDNANATVFFAESSR